MFSLFKRRGISFRERRQNDFAHAKGAIQKGETLTDRDKKMIAVGRCHVHLQNSATYKYKKSQADTAGAKQAKSGK